MEAASKSSAWLSGLSPTCPLRSHRLSVQQLQGTRSQRLSSRAVLSAAFHLASTHPGQTLFATRPGEEGQRSDAFLFSCVSSNLSLCKGMLHRNYQDGVYVCKNTQGKIISLVKAWLDFGLCRTTPAGLQTPIIRPTFPPALNTSFPGRKIND